VRVEDDPIRVGEEAIPAVNCGETVSDGDVVTLANTGDLSEDVVSLNIAA
jgi:hypothetical protein